MSTGRGAWHVGERLSLDTLSRIAAQKEAPAGILAEVSQRTRLARGHLAALLEREGTIYGVTTGFGDSCETPVSGALALDLPKNLFRFHGCGVGPTFDATETRAIILARLASLATGHSGVRVEVLEALLGLLDKNVLPLVPELGSVGASGDLTPLSYVARLLSGEGEALVDGRVVQAGQALADAGLTVMTLEPKESLSIMNGTSAMTGVAALCVPRALRLVRWASALTAATSDVLLGQPGHYDARIFAAKPHPGQALVAAWIRDDLEFHRARTETPARVQDRYSLRCAPHVLGVLVDLLPLLTTFVETELNGANDNPLVDPDGGDVLHGGNFYGGHVCSAMDTLKTQVANVVDLLDRQLALLCNPTTNHGLPANLVGASEDERAAHHGFKAMQITTSALAAEVARLCLPSSILSRSTENHNQDKVSMGTIAARDARTALDLAETCAAISTLAVAQAVELRDKRGCHRAALGLHAFVRRRSAFVTTDRALDRDIALVVEGARAGDLPLSAPVLAELTEAFRSLGLG